MEFSVLETGEKPFILIDACSYCWGAAATTSAVLKLIDRTIPIVFIGSGSSLEFFKKNKTCSYYIDSNTESFESLHQHTELIRRAEFCFVNVNPVMAILARQLKTKVMYLDILPWLEPFLREKVKTITTLYSNSEYIGDIDSAVHLLKDCEVYYQQRYLTKYPQDSIIQNLKKVPPVLNQICLQTNFRSYSHLEDNHLLIGLGGFLNPDIPTKSLFPYLQCLISIAEFLISSQMYERIIICTSNRVAESLRSTSTERANISVQTLSQYKYLEMMSLSKHVAIVPGLSSIYEAFYIGRPTLLLPPTNYSQVHQINAVYESQLAVPLVVEFLTEEERQMLLKQTEVEGTRNLVEIINSKIEEGKMFSSILDGFLAIQSESQLSLTSKRKRFMHEIGIQGAQSIASDIMDLWSKVVKS